MGFAEDENESPSESAAEIKARQAHELANSDMIHGNENWRALYFQNQQIIQLLKQMRDSLEAIKVHNELENTEEKKA